MSNDAATPIHIDHSAITEIVKTLHLFKPLVRLANQAMLPLLGFLVLALQMQKPMLNPADSA